MEEEAAPEAPDGTLQLDANGVPVPTYTQDTIIGFAHVFTGWAYPPKDYAQWGELVYQWAKHCVGRYGREEVERWYWEVWNEPNIGYWRGTPEEFLKLHDYAIAAVRRRTSTAPALTPHMYASRGT